jgi:hypothetical protein
MKQSVSSHEFNFKYEGDFQYIDVFPFLSSLGGLCKVLKEVSFSLYPGYDILIGLKETQKGSIDVSLALLAVAVGLFPIYPQAKEILEVFIQLLNLHKFLKGEPPKEIKQVGDKNVKIINSENQEKILMQNIYNIYDSHVVIKQEIQKSFSAMEQLPELEEFRIYESGKPRFIAKRKDFPYLAKTLVKETEKERILHTVATIHLIKPSFEKNYKWFVVYQANKIHVQILDEEFMEKVEKGLIRFGKGDALEVVMEIKQVFEPELNIFVNKEFKVLKVLRYIPSLQQKNIFSHFQE